MLMLALSICALLAGKKVALNLTFLVYLKLTLCIFSSQCACSLAEKLAYAQKIRKLEANRNLHVLFLYLNPQFGKILSASS